MDLFAESELQALSQLQLRRRDRVRGGAAWQFRSPDKGAGLEFADYRPYAPGDDIRRLDRHQYQKHRRLVVRDYERYESPTFDIIADMSASVACGHPHRLQSVRKLSAAYSFLLLRHGCAIIVRSTDVAARSFSGADQWASCAAHLAALPAGGDGDIVDALAVSNTARRPADGAVIVSDMLCSAGAETLKTAILNAFQKLTLVHVYVKADIEPELFGDVTLVDVESRAEQTMTLSAQAIDTYKTAYKRYYDAINATALAAGHQYSDVCGQHDFLDQLRLLAPTGVMIV